jgi:hypothetical protein
MSDRPICVGCGAVAPDTDTNHTLISSTFGWRLTRRKSFDGTTLLDWRCAKCWKQLKVPAAKPADATMAPRGAAIPPEPKSNGRGTFAIPPEPKTNGKGQPR